MLEHERKEQIEELKQNLESLLGPHTFKMFLFGSRARGDHSHTSDFDVAILIRGLTREMKHLVLEKVAETELEYALPLSTLVLSEEDFHVLKKRERRIVADIEREGIPL